FKSVKNERVINLAKYLEANHINVYSPRSDMFFERNEIKIALGIMMLLFPMYVQGLEQNTYQFLRPELKAYYISCIKLATSFLNKPEHLSFKKWIYNHGNAHISLEGSTDYTYSGLLYQMFEYEPFKSILSIDLTAGVVDVRPARNLALLSQVIGKYEYLHKIDVLSTKSINKNTEILFNLYIRLLYEGGISEYEDDAEYAPSGCVS
ncbi:MAG: DNA helicase II, partial [Veillonella dispar DORA_11]